ESDMRCTPSNDNAPANRRGRSPLHRSGLTTPPLRSTAAIAAVAELGSLAAMRTVGIPVHNNQTLDVFTRRRGWLYDGFEVWMVGIVKSERVILDHFITQEHLERRLAYARPGDLAWVDTELSALPSQKTRAAQEAEETIKRGKFLDLASLIYYFNAVYWL